MLEMIRFCFDNEDNLFQGKMSQYNKENEF